MVYGMANSLASILGVEVQLRDGGVEISGQVFGFSSLIKGLKRQSDRDAVDSLANITVTGAIHNDWYRNRVTTKLVIDSLGNSASIGDASERGEQ